MVTITSKQTLVNSDGLIRVWVFPISGVRNMTINISSSVSGEVWICVDNCGCFCNHLGCYYLVLGTVWFRHSALGHKRERFDNLHSTDWLNIDTWTVGLWELPNSQFLQNDIAQRFWEQTLERSGFSQLRVEASVVPILQSSRRHC